MTRYVMLMVAFVLASMGAASAQKLDRFAERPPGRYLQVVIVTEQGGIEVEEVAFDRLDNIVNDREIGRLRFQLLLLNEVRLYQLKQHIAMYGLTGQQLGMLLDHPSYADISDELFTWYRAARKDPIGFATSVRAEAVELALQPDYSADSGMSWIDGVVNGQYVSLQAVLERRGLSGLPKQTAKMLAPSDIVDDGTNPFSERSMDSVSPVDPFRTPAEQVPTDDLFGTPAEPVPAPAPTDDLFGPPVKRDGTKQVKRGSQAVMRPKPKDDLFGDPQVLDRKAVNAIRDAVNGIQNDVDRGRSGGAVPPGILK